MATITLNVNIEYWLRDHNIDFVIHKEPFLYYEIVSHLDFYDITNFKDCGAYFDDDNDVKILIPNYDTVPSDKHIMDMYPTLYFDRVICDDIPTVYTIFREGDDDSFDSEEYLRNYYGDKFKYLPMAAVAHCKTKEDCDALIEQLKDVIQS